MYVGKLVLQIENRKIDRDRGVRIRISTMIGVQDVESYSGHYAFCWSRAFGEATIYQVFDHLL
jgi:hypothetical protein